MKKFKTSQAADGPKTTTEFVLSLPADMPAKEAVAKAEAAGFTLNQKRVHNIRWAARHAAKAKTKTKTKSRPDQLKVLERKVRQLQDDYDCVLSANSRLYDNCEAAEGALRTVVAHAVTTHVGNDLGTENFEKVCELLYQTLRLQAAWMIENQQTTFRC